MSKMKPIVKVRRMKKGKFLELCLRAGFKRDKNFGTYNWFNWQKVKITDPRVKILSDLIKKELYG